jgi:hypothetical protein
MHAGRRAIRLILVGLVAALSMVAAPGQARNVQLGRLIYTIGNKTVAITTTCTNAFKREGETIFVGTGKGSDGRYYEIEARQIGVPTFVGVASRAFPPDPCDVSAVQTHNLQAGEYVITIAPCIFVGFGSWQKGGVRQSLLAAHSHIEH